jgi:hypothetical protein
VFVWHPSCHRLSAWVFDHGLAGGEVFEDPGHDDRWHGLDERRSDGPFVGPAGREHPRAGAGGVVGGVPQLRTPSANHSQRAAASPSYGSPTLPALTKRTLPTTRSSCWCVWPATTSAASSAANAYVQRSGDDSGEHLVVAARAGVAKEHAVELERQRQLTERARPLVADLGGP